MKRRATDRFHACGTLTAGGGQVGLYRLDALELAGLGRLADLPYSIRILLENVLRNVDDFAVLEDHVRALAAWSPASRGEREIPFKPARVLLQDFTGVPSLVDLAAMRSAMQRLGGDPRRINPQIPVDLVIDHSVQVDHFGRVEALDLNAKLEFHRNRERPPASCTRSTSNTWPRLCCGGTPVAAPWLCPTPSSAPTAIRR